jgi:hypothetical protein
VTKKEFVEGILAETLRNANLDVSGLDLSQDELHVRIIFASGSQKTVCIECDSFAGIILDVTRKAMY